MIVRGDAADVPPELAGIQDPFADQGDVPPQARKQHDDWQRGERARAALWE
jgi:hypothetical protein